MTKAATNLMNHAMSAMADPVALLNLANFMASRGYKMSKELARYAGRPAQADSDFLVSAQMVIETLDECVRSSGDPDFMFAFALWLDLRAFGPVTLLWEQCPDLKHGGIVGDRFIQTVNAAVSNSCELFDDEAHLVHDVIPSCRKRADQFLLGECVFVVRLMRMVMGESWSPLRVEIGFPYLGNPRLLESFFRCPITFNAERFVIIQARSELERPLNGGDPALRLFFENYLERKLATLSLRLEWQIERIIAANLEDGRATLDNVAGLLGMSGRTLQRRLAASGSSFTKMLNSVRRRVALAYLEENPDRRITDLGYRLGYSDISTVSRFLSSSFDAKGRELRQRFKRETGAVSGAASF